MRDFFWNIFQANGSVEAYLAYKKTADYSPKAGQAHGYF